MNLGKTYYYEIFPPLLKDPTHAILIVARGRRAATVILYISFKCYQYTKCSKYYAVVSRALTLDSRATILAI